MSFISFSFVLLLVICFIVYYSVRPRWQNVVLLLASFVFVGYAHLFFLAVALCVALVTYAGALAIEKADGQKKKQMLFWGTIALLVVTWLVMRYPLGMEETFDELTLKLGLPLHVKAYRLLFPLGISFYTFQALAYLTEVYWEEEKAERNVVDFLLYMLFFMKFLSGPIERPDGLLHQLKKAHQFDYEAVTYGLKLMFLGLVKKLVLADYLSPYIDNVYGNMSSVSGLELLVACLLYPIQLYADFSGYTDIALGGASMFGLKLAPNFDRPFISKTTAELWRRWHMSLSFWVRDYVYVPLTAETRAWGRMGVMASMLVTFVVLGIWHGAGWNYALYGMVQGLIIMYEMNFSGFRDWQSRFMGRRCFSAFSVVRTYALFAFSLVLFRSENLAEAMYLFRHLSFVPRNGWDELMIGMPQHFCYVSLVAFLLLLLYEWANDRHDVIKRLHGCNPVLRWCLYYVLVFSLFVYGSFNTDTFIYLQF